MIWNLENFTFVVLIICAACGALMALVSLVCEIVRMTPWGVRYFEKLSVHEATRIIDKNYIRYTCPECGNVTHFEHFIENYCNRCGHKITDEEKKKYERETDGTGYIPVSKEDVK